MTGQVECKWVGKSVQLPTPEYIRMEIEGRARLADYFSHDILNEAQDSYGAAAHLRKVLYPPCS